MMRIFGYIFGYTSKQVCQQQKKNFVTLKVLPHTVEKCFIIYVRAPPKSREIFNAIFHS